MRARVVHATVVVALGAVTGVVGASAVLWQRAHDDVAAYLSAPVTEVPGVVWSAPMTLTEGQQISMANVASDLLAAGYDRVSSLPSDTPTRGAGLFVVSGSRLSVWTAPLPELGIAGGRAIIELDEERRIRDVSTGRSATLRPTVLATIGDPDRRRQTPHGVSKWMEPALLSMEDVRFRSHHGVDPWGIARAVVTNVAFGNDVQGGSTLTQQLAKNLFLSPERTLRRKVREAFFAAALEHRLSKDELLELYLTEVYLGQMGGMPLHGVDAAARAWFGVGAGRLELHQAATLVGVIPAPNAYSPVRHPERALERRNLVLDRMVAVGGLSLARAEAAKDVPLKLSGIAPSRVRRAPYVVDRAVDEAERVLGAGVVGTKGIGIHTHIQPAFQAAAERAVADGMAELDEQYPKAAGSQVALVALDADSGAVVALVGGRSYAASAFNRATEAWRQAGSTVKPLTALAALEHRTATPASRLTDAPLTRVLDGKVWSPTNHDGKYLGEVGLREMLEGSRNIPAIHLAESVGMQRLQGFYAKAGLSKATSLPAAALGAFAVTPLQLAGAYTAFVSDGRAWEPQIIGVLTAADGEEVHRLEPRFTRLADPRRAAQVNHMLAGVVEQGTGARAARYGVAQPAAGKTGTTDAYRDAWFVGQTPDLVVAVWVGRDRGTLGLSGSRAALPTWARFVRASGTNRGAFEVPAGLTSVELCVADSQPPCPGCDRVEDELFPAGEEPVANCSPVPAAFSEFGERLGALFKRRDAPVQGAAKPASKSKKARRKQKEP